MIEGWSGDPDVRAWLIPINPQPPAPFDRLLRVRYGRTLVTQMMYWPLLVRELRRADVAHVFSASYASFLLAPTPAIVIARLLGKRVILNYRSGQGPDHLERSPLARWLMRRVDRHLVASGLLQEVFARFGIDADVVPNTIDLGAFAYRRRDPLRPRLLSTRNFEPHYNVACTLRAFALVQARYPEAELTLVGTGSCDAPLRALARELGLRNTRFAGRVDASQMPAYYDAADIFVQTPTLDNMPGSVIEAFASGLPTVATCVGGVPCMLTHGVHGLLAPDNDHAAVAAHVLALLEDPERARALAAAARTTCAAYEWTAVRAQWLDAYRMVFQADRRPYARPVARKAPAVRRAVPLDVPLRVAIVISSFDPGGTERQMSELICRLDPKRFEVHPVCFRRSGLWLEKVEAAAGPAAEFPLRSLRKPSTVPLAAAFVRWCRDRRIAVVQACDIYANIFALPAAASARVPLRIGSRRGIVNPTSKPGLLAMQRLAYRCAHHVVANSAAAARCLAAEGVPQGKIRTIANGIDPTEFSPAKPRTRRRVITTVANLRQGKGHDVLLRAFARVLEAIPDARLQLIGDGALRPTFEELANTLGVSDSVTFLGHRDDVPALLRESDLLVLPSFMEASPNAVMEAMATALPVVATDVGGIPELIENGRTGLLVPPRCDDALAAAMIRIMEHPAEASALGEAARQAIAARHSFTRMVGEFEALFTEPADRLGATGAVPLPSDHAA